MSLRINHNTSALNAWRHLAANDFKMSKSLDNYIGITDTADNIYGKVMSISDSLMFRYYELLSDLSAAEIKALESGIDDGTLHPKEVKIKLAKELTARFHGLNAAEKAKEVFEQVFKHHGLPEDIPELHLNKGDGEVWLPKLLVEAGLTVSTSEARRMIKQKAVSLDGEKVQDMEYMVQPSTEIMVKVGKRRFAKIRFQ